MTVDVKKNAQEIYRRLKKQHPDARIELNFANPFELLVATILSAQCTDVRVNLITQELFKKYRGPADYLAVPLSEIENDIRSTGFFRNKAKSIQGAAQEVLEKYNGELPRDLETLVQLPGVGRKTANVILGNAFGIPGIVVDTHVGRIALRIGLTKHDDPVKVEFDLMKLIPEKEWTLFSHVLIFHGRRICKARQPVCPACPVADQCDYFKANS